MDSKPLAPKPATQMLAWICGFFLVVNLPVVPTYELSPRATEVLAIILLALLLWKLLQGKVNRNSLIFSAVFVALPMWLGARHYLLGDQETLQTTIRWTIGAIWGAALVPIILVDRNRYRFTSGVWWGAVFGIGILVLEYFGFRAQLETVGLVDIESKSYWYQGRNRVSGLQAHPNGAMGIASLLVPSALYLYMVQEWRMGRLITSLVLLLVASQMTVTRSGIIVALLVLLLVFGQRVLIHRKIMLFITGIAFTIILSSVVAVFGPPGGWERWLNSSNIQENSKGRLISNLGAAELSFTHPLGLGILEARERLQRKTDHQATHNAFLIAGLVFGGPVASLIFLVMLIFWGMTWTRSDMRMQFAAIFILHLFGLFLFEEFLLNPTFIVFTFVILSYAFTILVETEKRENPKSALANSSMNSAIKAGASSERSI